MPIKHAKVSGAGPASDGTLVGGDDWDAAHVLDTAGLAVPSRADAVAAPASGVVVFSKNLGAGVDTLAWRGPSGGALFAQPWFGTTRCGWMLPVVNNAGLQVLGMPSVSSAGTPTLRTLAWTSMLASVRRVNVAVAANTPGTLARLFSNQAVVARNAFNGFRVVMRWIPADPATVNTGTHYSFYGVLGGTASVQPSGSTNLIGVGTDGGETTYSIFVNDGTGASTKFPLGADFPADTLSADLYQVTIVSSASTPGDVGIEVVRLTTGHVARMTISADLPVLGTPLFMSACRANGTSNQAVGFDFAGAYFETEF